MTSTTQTELLAKLADLYELSPEVRFGQLLANLGFLVEDQTDQSLWDIEDESMLEVMEKHRVDLARRQQAVEWSGELRAPGLTRLAPHDHPSGKPRRVDSSPRSYQ